MNHRGFVHDQHIHIQWVRGIVAEAPRLGPSPQQGVQGSGGTHALNECVQLNLVTQGPLQVF